MTRRLLTALLLAATLAAGTVACGDNEPTTVRTVSAAEIAAEVEQGEVLLVDVREPGEWDAGHAPGAIHVPLGEVEGRLDELRDEAGGRPIAFVCRTGSRSARAAQTAVDGGLDDVLHIDGGMRAWVDADLPLEPPGGRIIG